jgi:hypothetical protein
VTGPEAPPVEVALAGLAAELEALRRLVASLGCRVDDLGSVTAGLADRLRVQATPAGPRAISTWLVAPADGQVTLQVLEELQAWVKTVFLRYKDGAQALPECWLWHPAIVEELLWLMHAWLAASQGENASVGLVGDWHDRYRPGVARRIQGTFGNCSLEVHRDGYPDSLNSKRRPDAAEHIALWWAQAREERAPEPTPEHLAGGDMRLR